MNERDQAIATANRWLDGRMNALVEMVPGDPDCDACVLARQFLRAVEAVPDAAVSTVALVPRELTPEMLRVAHDGPWHGNIQGDHPAEEAALTELWGNLLAAWGVNPVTGWRSLADDPPPEGEAVLLYEPREPAICKGFRWNGDGDWLPSHGTAFFFGPPTHWKPIGVLPP